MNLEAEAVNERSQGKLDFKKIKSEVDVLTFLAVLYEDGYVSEILPEESPSKDDEYIGVCPICRYQSKKSFSVNVKSKKFVCFNAKCKKGGSMIDLVGYLVYACTGRPEGDELRQSAAYVQLVIEGTRKGTGNGSALNSEKEEQSDEESLLADSVMRDVNESKKAHREAATKSYDTIEATVQSHILFNLAPRVIFPDACIAVVY